MFNISWWISLLTACVQFLHKLTARALIRDYEDGSLDTNEAEHEVCLCARPKASLLGSDVQSEPRMFNEEFCISTGEESGVEALHHRVKQRVLHPVSVHQLCGHRGKGLSNFPVFIFLFWATNPLTHVLYTLDWKFCSFQPNYTHLSRFRIQNKQRASQTSPSWSQRKMWTSSPMSAGSLLDTLEREWWKNVSYVMVIFW